MCGIAGELNFSHAPSEADWDHISKLMKRRGPDDHGFWNDNKQCTMVFRRLSIIDLSKNGHQPMISGDGRYAIVFNGEVYNFKELRKTLISHGFKFVSTSDTEVVLNSLIYWGHRALSKLNGMFALAFYDCVKKKILLARDYAGIKPLYYLTAPQGVVFCSQYDQILAHPFSRMLKPSKEALGLYLRLAFIPAPYAFLEKTYMLSPGTWIAFDINGKQENGTFFTFPSYQTPELRGAEAIEAIDETLTQAVKRHLVSDVPLGGFLSGGIDSPLVMAKMSMLSDQPVEAYTISIKGEQIDESYDAIAYAKELSIKQHVIDASPDQALSMLDDVVCACGEPFGDFSIFPTMLISKHAREKFTVMLSGDGGDELFWGYPKRFGPLIKHADDFNRPYLIRRLRLKVARLFSANQIPLHLGWVSIGRKQRSNLTHLQEAWLKRLFPGLPEWPDSFNDFRFQGWGKDKTAQWLRWNEFINHLTMVLLKVDRASMYHSLEVRVPLLDKEVIETAMKVDWQSCFDLDTMTGKIPLRRILSKHLYHQSEQKRGFDIPMGSWLRTTLKQTFEQSVIHRDELFGVSIDKKSFQELFNKHLSGEVDLGWGLWPILSLSLWNEKFYNRSIRQSQSPQLDASNSNQLYFN